MEKKVRDFTLLGFFHPPSYLRLLTLPSPTHHGCRVALRLGD